MINNFNITEIILDYIPQNKLSKVTAYQICLWRTFASSELDNLADVYTFLDIKLKKI
jgi:hypothetical protein